MHPVSNSGCILQLAPGSALHVPPPHRLAKVPLCREFVCSAVRLNPFKIFTRAFLTLLAPALLAASRLAFWLSHLRPANRSLGPACGAPARQPVSQSRIECFSCQSRFWLFGGPTGGNRGMEGTTGRKEGEARNGQRTTAKSAEPIIPPYALRRRGFERVVRDAGSANPASSKERRED